MKKLKDIHYLRSIKLLTEKRRGIPPSIREIMGNLGLGSTNTVYAKIKRLKRRGLVAFELGKARTIHLTQSGITKISEESMGLPTIITPTIKAAEASQDALKTRLENTLKIIKLASEYAEWLIESGELLGRSSFCRKYPEITHNAVGIYEHVERIIVSSYSAAKLIE